MKKLDANLTDFKFITMLICLLYKDKYQYLNTSCRPGSCFWQIDTMKNHFSLKGSQDRKDTFLALTWLFLCLEILAVINGWVLASTGSSSSIGKYLGREIFVSLALVLPVLLPGWWGRGYAIMLYFGMAAFTATNWVHAYLFDAPATSYLLGILRETHVAEMHAFMTQFVDPGFVWRILATFIIPFPALLLSLRFRQRSFKTALLIAVVVLSVITVKGAQKDLTAVVRWHYAADMAWSCMTDLKEQKQFAAEITQTPDLPTGIHTSASNRIVVLVIGESSGRTHYSLYGYPRPTTPKLDARQEDLLVFTDVIAAHAHTISALQKGLTFANHEGDPARCSLVDVLKAAGYHTVALSNQPWLGTHETASSRLLDRADESRHFNTSNTDGFYQTASYDEKLLPAFEQAVGRPGNVAIILHLMGSHTTYRMRYPSTVEAFSDTPPSARQHPLTRDQIQEINDYDTSIAYTDIILDRLIDCLEKSKRPSAFLYFSDHADAVYEDGHTRGHAENAGSRYMFEIPFVVWLSPAYRQERPDFSQAVQQYTHRPWQADDLIYPVLDLAGIVFDGFKSEKSLLSPHFIREKRRMGDKDYDASLP